MFRTVPGLVLPPAARNAGAVYQHIPSFDVLQTADVAASRRSGSRTRERGRDLRSGAATLWSSPSKNFEGKRQCGRKNRRERFSRAIHLVLRAAGATPRGRIFGSEQTRKGNSKRISEGFCRAKAIVIEF